MAIPLHPASTRGERLIAELREGIHYTDSEELTRWGIRTAARFGTGTLRRGYRIAALAVRLSSAVIREVGLAATHAARGRLGDHLQERSQAALSATRRIAGEGAAVAGAAALLVARLRTEPAEAAPVLFGAAAGFLIGSGGLDADGGIPDIDLHAGIGAHRSIFTHSILAGAAAEAVIIGALDLVTIVYRQLPAVHDPIWDALFSQSLRFGDAMRRGIDGGLAYHLIADGTVQGITPYKDLPVHGLPMEAHQAILVTNGAAEGAVAVERRGPPGDGNDGGRDR